MYCKLDTVECPVAILCDDSWAFDCINDTLIVITRLNYGNFSNWTEVNISIVEQYVRLIKTNKNNLLQIITSLSLNEFMGVYHKVLFVVQHCFLSISTISNSMGMV